MFRTQSAGVNPEYISSLGPQPWSDERQGRRGGYVVHELADDHPLAALLWSEIRSAYQRHAIDPDDQWLFEEWIDGSSYKRLAEAFLEIKKRQITRDAICKRVLRVRKVLLADSRLGLLTVIYEQCGGWRAVGELRR